MMLMMIILIIIVKIILMFFSPYPNPLCCSLLATRVPFYSDCVISFLFILCVFGLLFNEFLSPSFPFPFYSLLVAAFFACPPLELAPGRVGHLSIECSICCLSEGVLDDRCSC